MNATKQFSEKRPAASPYARRLAREQGIDLANLMGRGPGNRILAADVLAWRAPVEESEQILPAPLPEPALVVPRLSPLGFTARVPLAGIFGLVSNMARVGLEIAVEDVAVRAARQALAGLGEGIAVEVAERQIVFNSKTALSVGAERRLRLEALANGTDGAMETASMSLLVLRSAQVVPVSMPILPGRILRLVLVFDSGREHGDILLCADGGAVSATAAVAILDAFVAALEEPLALLA